jgi:hypothetical protein
LNWWVKPDTTACPIKYVVAFTRYIMAHLPIKIKEIPLPRGCSTSYAATVTLVLPYFVWVFSPDTFRVTDLAGSISVRANKMNLDNPPAV